MPVTKSESPRKKARMMGGHPEPPVWEVNVVPKPNSDGASNALVCGGRKCREQPYLES